GLSVPSLPLWQTRESLCLLCLCGRPESLRALCASVADQRASVPSVPLWQTRESLCPLCLCARPESLCALCASVADQRVSVPPVPLWRFVSVAATRSAARRLGRLDSRGRRESTPRRMQPA